MHIEHAAFQVSDPVAIARWYVQHLDMTIKRVQDAPPFAHFLADSGGGVMIELYNNPAIRVPDYRQLDPMILHVGFTTADVAATRDRLIAAGATAEGDVQLTPAGDRVAMLRDPWGFAIQFVNRASPML